MALQRVCWEATPTAAGEALWGQEALPSLRGAWSACFLGWEGGRQAEWREPMPGWRLSQLPRRATPDVEMQSVGNSPDV